MPTYNGRIDGIVGTTLTKIMASHKAKRKRATALIGFSVHLESSASSDAEARLQQAYALVLRVSGATEYRDCVSRNGRRAKREPEPEERSGGSNE